MPDKKQSSIVKSEPEEKKTSLVAKSGSKNVRGKEAELPGFFNDPEWQEHQKELERLDQERKMISIGVNSIKKKITQETNKPEQLLFSFMPTEMTRTSPFFPINRRYMKERPYEEL